MKQVAEDKWRPASHWSLDGIPRGDATKRQPISLPENSRELAFRAIGEALPLFQEFDVEQRRMVRIEKVVCDLREL